MAKAGQAVVSARLLLEHGDNNGACNRAYYAMFDAARAALLAVQAPVAAEVARTHGGLISAFSLHLVKPGRVAVALGRALNRVQEIRLVADYRGDSVSGEQALWAVEQSEAFVAAIQAEFSDRW
ncbi:MAG: HEPN domain-containing protein [Candidatus Competibacteraceae bacterium]|nr:HEPN domain-containing protein [Candidatus Competibacteraceae bacterium]